MFVGYIVFGEILDKYCNGTLCFILDIETRLETLVKKRIDID